MHVNKEAEHNISHQPFSVVIPTKNEAGSIGEVVEEILTLHPNCEVIVVNDGSTDNTKSIASAAGAKVISHPYSVGNGAAIKSGVRKAKNKIVVFMDADGQHRPSDIAKLLIRLNEGYDMVVGARTKSAHAGGIRRVGNQFYNRLASWMVEQQVDDLTSGFRCTNRDTFMQFLHLLPNGFSYPTTSTMAYFRAGYSVKFEPIDCQMRSSSGGKSHIKLLKDGRRFFLIIMKVAVLFSPLRIFARISACFFATAACYFAFTIISYGRFTNLGALLFITAILTALIGLVSEQIATLYYMNVNKHDHQAELENFPNDHRNE